MENRIYYIKRFSSLLRTRVSKEEATNYMCLAAEGGRPYQVKQGKTFWKRIRTTTVESD